MPPPGLHAYRRTWSKLLWIFRFDVVEFVHTEASSLATSTFWNVMAKLTPEEKFALILHDVTGILTSLEVASLPLLLFSMFYNM